MVDLSYLFVVGLKEFAHAHFLNIIKGTNCNPDNKKYNKFLKKFGFARKQLIEAGRATEEDVNTMDNKYINWPPFQTGITKLMH